MVSFDVPAQSVKLLVLGPRERLGIGGPHHLVYSGICEDALLVWQVILELKHPESNDVANTGLSLFSFVRQNGGGNVLVNSCVQVNLMLLDKLHDSGGGKRLCKRGEGINCVRRCRSSAFSICPPESLLP